MGPSKLRSLISSAALVAMVATGVMTSSPVEARDFFSALFGGLFNDAPRSRAMRSEPLPFATDGDEGDPGSRAPRGGYSGGYGRGAAYCVRTCDGRHFPLNSTSGQSRAETCNSFCPASDTKVFYGGSIENASSENGKPYSELPNAFRYRNEMVAGCTCNGKDSVGLAKIRIEDDRTLRKGDVVAGPDGLMVASRGADRRGASLNFSPASSSLRARYDRIPVVAAE